MTYLGVFKALVILCLLVLHAYFWPDDQEGNPIDPKELQKWMEYRQMHEPPKVEGEMVICAVFLNLGLLAYALR